MSTLRRLFPRAGIRRDLLALLLVLGVAALFRLWRLVAVPPGLFGDEAVNGLDALDVLAGHAKVFYSANYGREGLAMLLFAASIKALGPTALALRLPTAVAGIATALATYWLGRELLARTRYAGRLTPLLAALLVSTSFWHVYTSRYAERLIFTPLMATLAFAAFWRAANALDRRIAWRWVVLAGVSLGLSLHFYSISRLLPVFLGSYLLAQAAYLAISRRSQATPTPPILRRAIGPVVVLFAVAVAVFAPLALYFLRHPGSFTQRAGVVSAFNPELNHGDPWLLVKQAGLANLGQFFLPGAGDRAPFFNLPGRAVFDPLAAGLALLGLALCALLVWAGLRRSASPARSEQGQRLLFLLLWFPVMLIPGLLAVDRFPALPRVMGVIPGVYFFPALALAELWQQARRRGLVGRRVAAALIAVALLVHGGLTWRDYFGRWANDPATAEAFEADIAAASAWMDAHPGQRVFLSSDLYRHPTWVYLHQHARLSDFFTYLDADVSFFDGRSALPLPTGPDTVYLFTANAGPDPLLASAPGWAGFAADTTSSQPSGLTVFHAGADAFDRSQFVPVELDFSPGPRLVGVQIQVGEAGRAFVWLLWHVDGPKPGWYQGLQVQAGWLPAGGGAQLAQVSGELAYRPTEWTPDALALSWLALPTPPDLASSADLVVRVVDQATGLPLPSVGSDADGWVVLPKVRP